MIKKQYIIRLITAFCVVLLGIFTGSTVSEAGTITSIGGYRSSSAIALDSSADSSKNSIITGTDGFPVIAYEDKTNGLLKFIKCGDASCSTTIIRTLDTLTSGWDIYPSITIGADGFPVIAYSDTTNGLLKFIKCDDASCSTTIISTLDAFALGDNTYPSIAIGSDGFPVISYQDTTSAVLKFIKCDDASCSTITVRDLFTVTLYSNYILPSIAIGGDGFPVIAYQDYTQGFLEFIKCDDASCSTHTLNFIDSLTGNKSIYPSVAIGANGLPIVSYTDRANGLLKFIKCNDASCSTSTISVLDSLTANNVMESSITLGADGFPVIAYTDYINGLIKFIQCRNSSCSTIIIRILNSFSVNTSATPSIARETNGSMVIVYSDYQNYTVNFIRLTSVKTTLKTTQNSVEVKKRIATFGASALVNSASGTVAMFGYASSASITTFLTCNTYACAATSSSVKSLTPVGADIKLGADGFPVLANYEGFNSSVAVISGATSTHSVIFSNGVNNSLYYVHMLIAPDGFPSIIYSDSDTGSSDFVHCTKKDCSALSGIQNIFNIVSNGDGSIAIGSDNFPMITYTIGSTIAFAKCADATCNSATTRRSLISSTASKVGKGGDNLPVIVSQRPSQAGIDVMHCGDTTCTASSTNFIAVTAGAAYFDTTINELGYPNIVYASSSAQISFLHCLDNLCSSYDQKNYNNVMQDTFLSLKITKDNNNLPLIAHGDYRYSGGWVYSTYYIHCGDYVCGANGYKNFVPSIIGGSQISTVGSGLLGYWSFNGTNFITKITDLSGNGHDAYFYGGATSSAKTIGKVGQGVKFNGGTQHVETINNVIPVSTPNGFSGAAWVKWSGSGSSPIIWETGGSEGFAAYFDETLPSGLGGWCGIRDSTNGYIDTRSQQIDVSKYQFSHIACVYDPTAQLLKFYLNGVLRAATTTVQYTSMNGAGGTTNIGGRTYGTDAISGVIDEVRMYNRALSASEVKKLYLEGK